MKYSTILMMTCLGFTGCSASDQTASQIFEAAIQTDFIQNASSIPCRDNNKIKEVSFNHKCWERGVSEAEIETMGREALELGLALQKAMNRPSELIETDVDELVVLRGEIKAGCAHYMQAYVTPVEDSVAPHTMRLNLGVTGKPHCGPLDVPTAS